MGILSIDHARVVDLLPRHHGLGLVDATKLAHALVAFSIEVAGPNRWFLPDVARGECCDATREFTDFVYKRHRLRFDQHQFYFKATDDRHSGYPSHWTRINAIDDRKRYPFFASRRGNYCDHWVARRGRLMIDWTARQFVATAPWPALWIDDPNEQEE